MVNWTAIKAGAKAYGLVIKILGALAIGLALFVGGCNYGKRGQSDEVISLTAQVSTLKAANKTYADEARVRNKEFDSAKAREKDLLDRASNAEAELEKERLQREQKQVKRDASLRKAISDPRCQEVLEMNVCSIVPLP